MKGRTFVGYAGVYGSVADLGEFTESVIFPAFRDVLERQKENVPFLYDHDGAPVATWHAGTLRLSPDTRAFTSRSTCPGTTSR